MGVRDAIDSCVDVGVTKGHVECDGINIIRVSFSGSDDFGLICTRPGFTPRHQTGLTRFPADCSG
jgi:hypothetical protein